MINLFVLNETFTNGLNYSVINFISFTSILCGIFVIISKNPIVSVLFLIGLFLNIAGYLMMLGMNFIGLSYLLVYVGAVSILFLFILMLINIRISELTSDSSNSIPLAIIIGIFFNITLYKLLPSNMLSPNIFFLEKKFEGIGMAEGNLLFDSFNNTTYPMNNSIKLFLNNDLSFVTSQIWDGALAETSHITSIGNIIYTSYPLWLILTSLILLLAMVGAIVITIKK
jgi:NADH-ubiquinone oxidoreductase chain 6